VKSPKTVKYSDLKRRLKLDINGHVNQDLAGFSHYLHTKSNGVSHNFRNAANRYLQQIDVLSLLEEPNFQLALPIEWDVPFPPTKQPKFSFIDLFAGVGGFRLAYQNLGGKCVFSSEWNKYAQITYHANFGEIPFGDITKIKESEVPDHDVLLAGFPCQPFSLAGVSKKNSLGRAHGFLDKTQGNLFFDIARILKAKRPRAFVLENVKNLVSHDKGKTFEVISSTLSKLEYTIHTQIIDGKHFVPQHRERIFIVGFDKRAFKGKEKFSFPALPKTQPAVEEILDPNPESRFTLSDHLWDYLQRYANKHREKGNGFGFGLINPEGITRTLSARYHKDGSEILIPQGSRNPRRLTPRECARLMGYPDKFIFPVSDTQAYRQFGNSVIVPLVQSVGAQVVKTLMTLGGYTRTKSNSLSSEV
jgi:DNA (cytosine-5)-methyltransferase 1